MGSVSLSGKGGGKGRKKVIKLGIQLPFFLKKKIRSSPIRYRPAFRRDQTFVRGGVVRKRGRIEKEGQGD